MNTLKYTIGVLALALSSIFATSCSDDKDETINIVFPEAETNSHEIGEKGKINFSAASNWKLSSSENWVKFLIDDKQELNCSGSAGIQEIEYIITNENSVIGKENSAEIKLYIGSMSSVIMQITRKAEGYVLVTKDTDGNILSEETLLEVMYEGTTSFIVNANFEWAVTECPQWLTVSSDASGAANIDKEVSIKIKEGYSKAAVQKDAIVFNNKTGVAKTSLYVTYDGIPADKVEFSQEDRAGWHFTADSRTHYKLDINTDKPVEEFSGPMTMNIITRNNKVEFINVGIDNDDNYSILYDKWLEADLVWDTEDEYDIMPWPNNGDKREVILLAIPSDKYNEIEANLHEAILEIGSEGKMVIKEEYLQYFGLHVIQEASVNDPFTLVNTGNELELISSLTQQDSETLINTYGTDNVWILPFDKKFDYEFTSILLNNLKNPMDAFTYSTVHNGVDTKWDGVELWEEFSWENGKQSFNIGGVSKISVARDQMIIYIYHQDAIYGVFTVDNY